MRKDGTAGCVFHDAHILTADLADYGTFHMQLDGLPSRTPEEDGCIEYDAGRVNMERGLKGLIEIVTPPMSAGDTNAVLAFQQFRNCLLQSEPATQAGLVTCVTGLTYPSGEKRGRRIFTNVVAPKPHEGTAREHTECETCEFVFTRAKAPTEESGKPAYGATQLNLGVGLSKITTLFSDLNVDAFNPSRLWGDFLEGEGITSPHQKKVFTGLTTIFAYFLKEMATDAMDKKAFTVLVKSGLDDVVRQLPDGYKTKILNIMNDRRKRERFLGFINNGRAPTRRAEMKDLERVFKPSPCDRYVGETETAFAARDATVWDTPRPDLTRRASTLRKRVTRQNAFHVFSPAKLVIRPGALEGDVQVVCEIRRGTGSLRAMFNTYDGARAFNWAAITKYAGGLRMRRRAR